ncbi:hypothetical protein [Acinetobacter parvus]|uniref:Uncharacterized protein n=1 Tax=Acinetobacter parvus DSM 16617 = CIP 108168 TaxID=981333 RepID=N8RKU9_9GAMM|nr:hypothetical protein [Acinetobacter parvus]ENU36018.1 hypothetical protein F988_01769 [Acinetobacter parvus DSM 16617 = CIP 108168]
MKNIIRLFLIIFILSSFNVYAEKFSERFPNLIKDGVLIKESDYLAQGLKPYYKDSEIYFFEDTNVFFEMKLLPLDTIMIRDMDNDVANFGYGLLHNYPDQSWQVKCTKDKITDQVTCAIFNNTVNIMHTRNRRMVSSTKNMSNLNFKKEQLLRIDKNKAISVNGIFENEKYNQIVSQMKNGIDVKSRFYDLSGNEYNNEANLQGFKEAYLYMTKLETKLNAH